MSKQSDDTQSNVWAFGLRGLKTVIRPLRFYKFLNKYSPQVHGDINGNVVLLLLDDNKTLPLIFKFLIIINPLVLCMPVKEAHHMILRRCVM